MVAQITECSGLINGGSVASGRSLYCELIDEARDIVAMKVRNRKFEGGPLDDSIAGNVYRVDRRMRSTTLYQPVDGRRAGGDITMQLEDLEQRIGGEAGPISILGEEIWGRFEKGVDS